MLSALCRRALAAGLFALPLGLPGQEPAAALQAAGKLAAGQPVTIVAFGDSVTGLYYHTGGQRAWCDLLGIALRRIYPQARVTLFNAGVSGNTSAQGLARLDRDVLSHRPQLVVTMFGLNDVAKGRGPDEYRHNLREIARRCRAAGAEVIFLTPNPVLAGDPERPPGRVAQYAQIMREAAAADRVPVGDAYAAYAAIRAVDPSAADRLMSQTIHPNLRGHAIFAEEAAWVISGQRVWLSDLGRPEFERSASRWAQMRTRVAAGESVRVLAMAPLDRWIGGAIERRFPGARVEVRSWAVAGKSLVQLAAEADGWKHFATGFKPDLVVVTVPPDAGAAPGDFFRDYSAVVNGTLPFGRGGWDYLVVAPGVWNPAEGEELHAAEPLAAEVALGKDLPWLERRDGDRRPPSALLAEVWPLSGSGPR